jgi:nicotinamidase-related amidase
MQIDVIHPKKTAMIVVDMQNDFVAPGAAMETPCGSSNRPQAGRGIENLPRLRHQNCLHGACAPL